MLLKRSVLITSRLEIWDTEWLNVFSCGRNPTRAYSAIANPRSRHLILAVEVHHVFIPRIQVRHSKPRAHFQDMQMAFEKDSHDGSVCVCRIPTTSTNTQPHRECFSRTIGTSSLLFFISSLLSTISNQS